MKAHYILLSLFLALPSWLQAQADTCIDFEDFTVGTSYSNDTSFAEDGVLMTIGPYENANGLVTTGTGAIVGSSPHQGNSLSLSNATVELAFDCVQELTLVFSNNGGNVNININGVRKFTKDLSEGCPDSIGGGDVVVNHSGNAGTMSFVTATQNINSLCIGGQEFLVDHICFLPCDDPNCFDFEGLTGSSLDVGDSFVEDGVKVNVVSFGNSQGAVNGSHWPRLGLRNQLAHSWRRCDVGVTDNWSNLTTTVTTPDLGMPQFQRCVVRIPLSTVRQFFRVKARYN